MMTAHELIEQALLRWRDSDRATMAKMIVIDLLQAGYVIKRAVPPCRGYEGDNDASGE